MFARRITQAALYFICFILFCFTSFGQDITDGNSQTIGDSGGIFVIDESDPNFVGPPFPKEFRGLPPPGTELSTKPPPPKIEIYSDQTQQIPILRIKGEYLDPSGLGAAASLMQSPVGTIKKRLQRAHEMGFRCFLLRVDWPSIEPQPDKLDTLRIRSILDSADELGMKVVINLDFSRAPSWFFAGDKGSDRLMVNLLIDPAMETALGNDGVLKWSDGTGFPLFYHPDTIKAINKLIYGIYYSLKDENALLGWIIDGPVTFSYPGGGRDAIVGVADYSPYSANRYYEETGETRITYPEARWSNTSRDSRNEWRDFMRKRIDWKREVFSSAFTALKEVDKEHLVLIGMTPVLNYRHDNGYTNMVMASDSTWQLANKNTDGAAIAFKVASNSFDPLNKIADTSAYHLMLTINQVLRRGKIALVIVEPDTQKPPTQQEILQIAFMIKASGAYPIWTTGFLNKRGPLWSYRNENAIEQTQPLTMLPPPKRLRRGNIAIVDTPVFYSSFYSDRDGDLTNSLTQLPLYQRAGIIVEVVGEAELGLSDTNLAQYKTLIFLDPEPLNNQSAKSWLSLITQTALGQYRANNGVLDYIDPLMINQFRLDNFHSAALEDQIRRRFVTRGAIADQYHGGDALVVANDPYIFMNINSVGLDRYFDVKLSGWPQRNVTRADFVDIPENKKHSLDVKSGSVSFYFGPSFRKSHLFILSDDLAPISRLYENRLGSILISQQNANMRRGMPAAVLFALLLIVTLLWMSFQSQQKSLLHAAELEEKRRRIEPPDLLDDAEVMAFYKKYISSDEVNTENQDSNNE